MQEIMTVQEAAQFLNIGETLMYRLLRNGAVHGRKIGHIWRIRRQDLLDYFDQSDDNIHTWSCADRERSVV